MGVRPWLGLFITAMACGQPSAPAPAEPPGEPDPAPHAPAAPVPATPRAAPVHRARGPIHGRFVPESVDLASGAPLLFRFEVENTGSTPIAFDHGGDYFGFGPARYTWVVWGADGEVECDLRAHPRMMAGGGAGGTHELAPGARWVEWVGPQTTCDALLAPGRHRIRVVRVLTRRAPDGPECSEILVPDPTVDPLDDRGVPVSPECAAFFRAAPAVATEVEIDVRSYDRAAIRAAGEAALADPDERHGHAVAIWAEWLGERADLERDWSLSPTAWARAVLDRLPEVLP